MEFDVILRPENLRLFWEGSLNSLALLLVSLVVGGLLSLPMALARVSARAWLRGPVWLFTYVLRGTPLLIQVYLIYYGLGQLEWIQARWDSVWPWTHFKQPFFCALLAFSLNTAGYTAEMLAGAIRENGLEAAQYQVALRQVEALEAVAAGQGKQTIILPAAALEAFGDAFKLLKGGK